MALTFLGLCSEAAQNFPCQDDGYHSQSWTERQHYPNTSKETNLDFAYSCYRRLPNVAMSSMALIRDFDETTVTFEEKPQLKVQDFDLSQHQGDQAL